MPVLYGVAWDMEDESAVEIMRTNDCVFEDLHDQLESSEQEERQEATEKLESNEEELAMTRQK